MRDYFQYNSHRSNHRMLICMIYEVIGGDLIDMIKDTIMHGT